MTTRAGQHDPVHPRPTAVPVEVPRRRPVTDGVMAQQPPTPSLWSAEPVPRRTPSPASAPPRTAPPRTVPLPPTGGLYDPRFEHDACGVALVADLHGRPSHTLVRQAISALEHLAHRGATGSEEDSGDGAGILFQVPHDFYAAEVGFDLPPRGHYATGIAFLSRNPGEAADARSSFEKLAGEEGLVVLGWRDVPVDDRTLGSIAEAAMPSFHQVFVTPVDGTALAQGDAALATDRLAFILRKRAEHEIGDCYIASLSSRTITYKGMLTSHQLAEFFPDLSDERLTSGLALVHSRFSTNTFPSWPLAHPYRYLAHNGEINTLAGNRNWMRAREALCASRLLPGLERAFPIVTPGFSDSASFDEVLELLHLGGRSLPHAVLMMIPEAWENHPTMDPARRAFYRYHASLMEPWDGPAAVAFTDGRVIGAVLDRNGLRPARYWVTDDGLVVLASEVGVVDVPPREGGSQGQAAARPDVPGRHRARPDRRRRRDQGRPGGGRALSAVARGRTDRSRRPSAPDHAHAPARLGGRSPTAVRLHQRGAAPHPPADGAVGSRALGLDGHRHPDRRPVGPAPTPLRLLHPALRPGHQPSAGCDPRGAGHLPAVDAGPRVERARAVGRVVPPDRAAHAGHRQRRPGQAPLCQRGRQHARVPGLRHRRTVRGGRGRPGPPRRHRAGP